MLAKEDGWKSAHRNKCPRGQGKKPLEDRWVVYPLITLKQYCSAGLIFMLFGFAVLLLLFTGPGASVIWTLLMIMQDISPERCEYGLKLAIHWSRNKLVLRGPNLDQCGAISSWQIQLSSALLTYSYENVIFIFSSGPLTKDQSNNWFFKADLSTKYSLGLKNLKNFYIIAVWWHGFTLNHETSIHQIDLRYSQGCRVSILCSS